MKLATCFLVVKGVDDYERLEKLVNEVETILKKEEKQKVLPPDIDKEQVVITSDPYTEEEHQEEPSCEIKNCLVTVRLWYSVFEGPAVSIIMVGPPESIAQLKERFYFFITETFEYLIYNSVPEWWECRKWLESSPKKSFYQKCESDEPKVREEFSISEDIFDCPNVNELINNYFYAELLAKDLREGILKLKHTGPTLWDEVKTLKIIGDRLSGEPEILHELEDHFRNVKFYPINREQIKIILKLVPEVFPEDWKTPDSYDKLTSNQQVAYKKIAKKGFQSIPGPIIQKVIELALEIKQECRE